MAVLLAVAFAAAFSLTGSPLLHRAAAQSATTGASGLPLPRFVSLKSSRVNVRLGPGQDYDIAWVFVRPGLPVEIVQEFDNWRKIRDSEGSEGWVFHSLLSGRRTAMVAPWRPDGTFPLRRAAEANAPVTAYLESRVVANVTECRDGWCEIGGDGFSGWMEQDRLWGVYPDELLGSR